MSTLLDTPPLLSEQEVRIAEGIAVEASRLDRLYPGWHRVVKPDELEMVSVEHCVLGQLGSFSAGWQRVKRDASVNGTPIYGAAYSSNGAIPYWTTEIEMRRRAG